MIVIAECVSIWPIPVDFALNIWNPKLVHKMYTKSACNALRLQDKELIKFRKTKCMEICVLLRFCTIWLGGCEVQNYRPAQEGIYPTNWKSQTNLFNLSKVWPFNRLALSAFVKMIPARISLTNISPDSQRVNLDVSLPFFQHFSQRSMKRLSLWVSAIEKHNRKKNAEPSKPHLIMVSATGKPCIIHILCVRYEVNPFHPVTLTI